ncbi:MAG: DUF1727 domain-containing protein [Blautia sp.]|nr:DUF1727 domain-containing protein [Blautia sp.]
MKKPNVIRTVLSVAACKLTRFILRKTGRGGTAIPGIVAMKIAGNILLTASEGMEIVVVTGTNGKTTTCNMIEHALTQAGCDCLLNKSGANLLHGIAADLISNTSWLGKPKSHYAVLECDEAALKQLVPFISPKAIVVTNLFSDQVDRYGGVENTLKEIRMGVEKSPSSTLVLNAEEPLSASLALNVPNSVVWYGLDKTVGPQGNIDLADAGFCPVCDGSYKYDYHVYAHLGGFYCPKCGYKRKSPDVAVVAIEKKDTTGSTVLMKADDTVQRVVISLPAVYNIYNAAAAVAAAKAMGVSLQKAMDSLASVRSSFGRLESFDLHGNPLQMILVKNPAGCNQAFSYLLGVKEDFTLVLCLNDRTGDGHDISWINATDYEKLCEDPHVKKIFVCGDRAQDLFERLKKAGAEDGLLQIVTDYQELLKLLLEQKRPIFALPNYTAMMELRQVLVQETGKKDFWE